MKLFCPILYLAERSIYLDFETIIIVIIIRYRNPSDPQQKKTLWLKKSAKIISAKETHLS